MNLTLTITSISSSKQLRFINSPNYFVFEFEVHGGIFSHHIDCHPISPLESLLVPMDRPEALAHLVLLLLSRSRAYIPVASWKKLICQD